MTSIKLAYDSILCTRRRCVTKIKSNFGKVTILYSKVVKDCKNLTNYLYYKNTFRKLFVIFFFQTVQLIFQKHVILCRCYCVKQK